MLNVSGRTSNLGQRLAQLAGSEKSTLQKLDAGLRFITYNVKKLANLRLMQKPSVPGFSGWGMTTKHALPWRTDESSDPVGLKFAQADQRLRELILSGGFNLSQFNGYGTIPPEEYCDPQLSRLRYRHFMVFWSAVFAARQRTSDSLIFVEAGACDGLTAFFAEAAIRSESISVKNTEIYLYDSWAPMRLAHLRESELHLDGSYSYLSLDQTRRNLATCEGLFRFIKGAIPEVFAESKPHPSAIDWLHIDLNSAEPTKETLDYFFPKLNTGGLILFDDYGHGGYFDTKHVVDQYFSPASGILFPLPTGQAIFFKL
jgi:hypothetical protein